MYLSGAVLLLSLLVYTADAVCSRSDWKTTMSKQGLSKCDSDFDFISGLYRGDRTRDDNLNLLEQAECCSREAPWTGSYTQVVYADWWNTFDKGNFWSNCPAGYFLHGLYRSKDNRGLLFNIEEGRCSKPADHPLNYGHCYDADISTCFDNRGLCRCNSGYYITGLFRGVCHNLNCLDKLRCCKLATAPEQLNDLYKVKTRIMDTTLTTMALLAHYLGYGWAAGCRSPYVGEDFRRSGDTWYADKSGRCEGHSNDRRLNLAFGDWSYEIKDIQYGNPSFQSLATETIDTGTIYNNDPTQATKSITRSEISVRSVTHTVTSSFSAGSELNIQLTYTPPSLTGGFGASYGYKFNYQNSRTTTDESRKEQSKTFTVSTSKTLERNSAAKWRLVLTKTRTSMTYTATIIAKFSTEFQGFMRCGGGANSIDTNYHYQYRGRCNRPNFNYKFGDSNTAFYRALKRQSEESSRPWLWNDMKNAFPNAQNVINDLSNENRYVFTVTGRFDDVIGTDIHLYWDAVGVGKRSAERGENVPDQIYRNSTHVAQALPNDVPPVKLDPPQVNIRVENQARPEDRASSGS